MTLSQQNKDKKTTLPWKH